MTTFLRHLVLLSFLAPAGLHAHPGRTAEDGCHQDGEERHCHGETAARSSRWAPHASWARTTVRVYDVVDGDTVKVETLTEPAARYVVRFRGIDCPERGAEGATAATEHVRRRLLGRTVVLQSGLPAFERDRYGRTLAYVERVGVDIGRELIEKNLCKDYSHRYPHARQERYLRTQEASERNADGGM